MSRALGARLGALSRAAAAWGEIRASAEAAQAVQGESGGVSLPQANTRPMHSERLVRQLTGNKVGITAAVLASKPAAALALLVARLASQVLDINGGYGIHSDFGIGVRLDQENLDLHAPDFAASKAGQDLAQVRQHWLGLIPNEDGSGQWAVLDWALGQDTETLLDLLAYLVAASVRGVSHQEPTSAMRSCAVRIKAAARSASRHAVSQTWRRWAKAGSL